MAQLRQDYQKFINLDTEIVVIGPESQTDFINFWNKENLPFIGLSDEKHRVLKLFGQEVNIFKLGRMPAQAIIDKQGIVRYIHYGKSMADIPVNEDLLAILDSLNLEILTQANQAT